MNRPYYLYILILILTCSCSSTKLEQLFDNVSITGYENQSLDFASLASKVDTMFFYVKEGANPISTIKDIYQNDSLLYVADANNCISVFDMYSGELLKQTRGVGHSSQEYLNIISIRCMNDTLFVLDDMSRKVIKYDKMLNFLGKINLSFVPLDFEITNDGFLFSRLDATANDHRFVQTDKSGVIKNKFVIASSFGDQVYTHKSFVNRDIDEIYLHEPMSNDIYRWDNGKVMPAYKTIFPNHKKNGEKEGNSVIPKDYFITSTHLISSFIYDNKQCYCIYSKNDDTVKAGSFDLNSGLPFSPIFQKGNSLMGLYHTEDLQVLKNWKPKRGHSALTLFVYSF